MGGVGEKKNFQQSSMKTISTLISFISQIIRLQLGAVHIVRTQQGVEGGSTKSVLMRAGGGGVSNNQDIAI